MSPFELTIVLASAFLHAIWNAWAKNNPNPTAFLAIMGIATTLLGLLLLPFVDLGALPAALWPLLVASALVHTLYQLFLGRAYEAGDLSVVYPIARSTPAFVALVAVPLLDDPVSVIGGVGIGIVLAGMWLVHTNGRIDARALITPGVRFAYLTLATTVGYSILDKMAMQTLGGWSGAVPAALVYFFLLTGSHTLLFVPYAAMKTPKGSWNEVLRSASGKLTFGLLANVLSYVLILHALATASVSYVTAVRQTSVVFAALIATLLLGERPSRARSAGTLLTVFGVAVIAMYP